MLNFLLLSRVTFFNKEKLTLKKAELPSAYIKNEDSVFGGGHLFLKLIFDDLSSSKFHTKAILPLVLTSFVHLFIYLPSTKTWLVFQRFIIIFSCSSQSGKARVTAQIHIGECTQDKYC